MKDCIKQPTIKSLALSIASILILSSCTHDNLNVALQQASENRSEIELVFSHYSEAKDSLKLKASKFLVKNMVNRYGIEGRKFDLYDTVFNFVDSLRKHKTLVRDPNNRYKIPEIEQIWNFATTEYGTIGGSDFDVKLDLIHLDSRLIIENIDLAFEVWQLPWSRHLRFDDFCEYILPHRFGNEKISTWRSTLLNKYKDKIDSLKNTGCEDPLVVAKFINEDLLSKWIYSHTLRNYPIGMTIENLLKSGMGSCTHQAQLGIYSMRALGIPVVHEEILYFGNSHLGHEFNSIVLKDGSLLDFDVGNKNMGGVIDERYSRGNSIPKIYRKTFEAVSYYINKELFPYFQNPNLKDVTSEYISTKDIEIEKIDFLKENSIIYLCIFNNSNWVPVSISTVSKGQAIFQDMGLGIVYLPMIYTNEKLVPVGEPIILDKNSNTKKISHTTNSQKIEINRKYHPNKGLPGKMIGGKFQVSNDKNFNESLDIVQIDDSLELIPKTIELNLKKNYRYIRYLIPKGSMGDLAEFSVTSNSSTTLSGEVICSFNLGGNKTIKFAFDNNPLSFLSVPVSTTEEWIGLDLKSQKEISQVTFCPRTDKNNIWAGLSYELFYWSDEWKSIGIQTADSYSLIFSSPISNGLFLLRCLDEGTEERIFTYEQGEQVWW
ncbi:hypothetical protein [Lunatimonas salinarum]|uniref:hypothetical protein n=1 Tax=Lunatimonas salinarum TaxID=1774590 RepID=UPI001ADFA07C|nr:hypothetical protein [Lunatimonas salinarum]